MGFGAGIRGRAAHSHQAPFAVGARSTSGVLVSLLRWCLMFCFFRVAPSAFFRPRMPENGNVLSFVSFSGLKGVWSGPVSGGLRRPRGVLSAGGSDQYTSSGCLAHLRGPFSSRSTTRSKGEKRREKEHHPEVRALVGDTREGGGGEEVNNTKMQRYSPLETEEQWCVWGP